MPPDRVCAAAGRADASDAPTSAPRISRRWGLKSCMGEILAPPRGARRTPWPVAGGQARRPVLLGWSGGGHDRRSYCLGRFGGNALRGFLGGGLGRGLGGLLGLTERCPTLLGGGDDARAPLGAQHALLRFGRSRLGLRGVVGGPPLLFSSPDAPAGGGAHGPLLCAGFRRGRGGLAGSRLPSKLAA